MAHVKGHKKGKVQKKKKSKPLTKRIYTGGIFAGPGKITKRKKKQIADLRAKYIKNKKAIEESTDWDQTHDEEKDKLLGKFQDDKGRIIDQTVKDRDLIEDYGLRGAKARSFMTERGEKYSEPEGEYLEGVKVKKAGGGMTGVGLYPAEMARAGTMSQAKRKRYMKKGGGITYKMTGGQVVSHGYD